MTSRAIHAWSLHRTLGRFVSDEARPPGGDGPQPSGPVDGLALLELPRALADRGYDTVQLCHFHLPARTPGYLSELRQSLAEAAVTLDALLVDAGDLVHPHDADQHERWIAGWLDDAAALGAGRVRVIAGQAEPTADRLQDSARRLSRLAAASPIRVVTENWMALLPSAVEVHQLLDATEGQVGLLVDLGNWTGADKYQQLASIGGRAETSHAKCRTDADGSLDTADYRRSLQAVLDAGFAGPLALVYDGPRPDEWAALAAIQDVVDEVAPAR